ncbi:hypothetical protein AAV94_04425 [Lampropedia cohaerens]|uniref:Fimbrial protein n=1 Tax=Lampropedia cohaerens TaxID=1610491 RepID=A0A0U1Q1H9_9BURK|nr:PilN domain-containing protein [Lampropedia cohaerens]KKW68613.1 hypothetical protein AAV94_04425 [Lampropedia cohaerens]
MIRINLLPHREAAKKARKESFMASCVLAGIVGILLAGGVYLYFQSLISDQLSANSLIEQENARIKAQIREVAEIEAEIAALKARQAAVENLQSERNLPVELMNQIIREVPNGSYVTSLNRAESVVSLSGFAQSNQTVSQLLRNISENMPWNTQPQLIETKVATVNVGGDTPRQVYGYSLNFRLDKPEQEQEQPR